MIDYPAIWDEVTSNFPGYLGRIHGPEHWRAVEHMGVKKIAHLMDAFGKSVDCDVIRLFAVLHDSCRQSDNHDPEHGRRAAEYAKEMRGRLYDLDDPRYELLYRAIAGHADGYTSEDLTIGACWDADRWDLWRVGITIDPTYISIPEMRVRVPKL